MEVGCPMDLNGAVESAHLSETQDMRRSQRYKINLHVIISTLVRGINKLIPGYGRNLCEGGICVFVPAQLRPGDAVEIALQLPGAQGKSALQGRIKSAARFDYSIEFTLMDEPTRKAIADSCKRLAAGK